MRYTDSITLPGEMSLATADSVIERIREVGSPVERDTPFGRHVDFTMEADDLWDLRDQLDELETTLASEGVDWRPDKAKVSSAQD